MTDLSNPTWLEDCLEQLPQGRVGVFGDFGLDAYWEIDEGREERSLETGLPIRHVRRQRYDLGGAGNVAANLMSLGVGRVDAVGVVGMDPFGDRMCRLLADRGIDTTGIVRCREGFQTIVYGKPITAAGEINRFDFGTCNELAASTLERAMNELDRIAGACDVVILNQQVESGVNTPEAIDRINAIIGDHPATRFIVDARDKGDRYHGCILKLNLQEAVRFLSNGGDERCGQDAKTIARRLHEKTGRPVFVTRAEAGILVADADRVHEVPGIQIIDRIDPVGAGDTVVAALAGGMAIGRDPVTCAQLANLAASITIRKLRMTGTATPAEMRAVGAMPDYIYEPDLAADPRHAKMIEGTEFEIIHELPQTLGIRHAIFDHDGTLSTLREGWEKIMEPMMVRAILGERIGEVSKETFDRITAIARRFIDRTTGIQTLVQMQGLVKIVHECGYVPADRILDEAGYKRVYNEQLLEMVRWRIRKLERGELESGDFQIRNAAAMLKALHARGVKLYLASGTDEQDVVAEARAMGYADLFEGRIFGAVGDVNVEAKKVVLERIIRENGLSGHEFVTFGDGPVEMRETRKRGGICVGLCSDEVRRFGMNPAKRGRLIRGGAGLLIPDFSQLPQLMRLLQLA